MLVKNTQHTSTAVVAYLVLNNGTAQNREIKMQQNFLGPKPRN